MLTPPSDIAAGAVASFVATTWGTPAAPAEFVPVGEDSWNYRCGPLWVSLRRDLRGHVPAAYAAAAEFASAGLEFVLAPIPTRQGAVTATLRTYPVLAFPYRDVTPLDGATMSGEDCAEAVAMLRRLHASRATLDLPEEDFGLPFESDIVAAIEAGLGGPADTGPLSPDLAILLRHHADAIAATLTAFHRLADEARRRAASWGPTHGEPLPHNFLRSSQGILLADWGETALGPPERDFANLVRTTAARPPGEPGLLELYRLRWILSEIAEYSSVLLAPHVGHADDRAMLGRLLHYLPPPADATIPAMEAAWTA